MNTAEYLVERLAALGIGHAFGLPGDYAFPINNAVEGSPNVKWIGSANELNAAYEADGYARIKGAAILSTTFAVGELSALNGVMGSKAENLIVFHLVGQPSTRIQRARASTHHTLGDGDFQYAVPLSAAAACVSGTVNPDNVHLEAERMIREAVYHNRPAYIYIPQDLAVMPVCKEAIAYKSQWKDLAGVRAEVCTSMAEEVDAAIAAIVGRMKAAKKILVFVSHKIQRFGLQEKVIAFLKKFKLPYVTMTMDKGAIDETSLPDLFLGTISGHATPDLTEYAKNADLIIDLGWVHWLDLNTSAWTHQVDEGRLITLAPHHVACPPSGAPLAVSSPAASYGPIWLGDLLDSLIKQSLPVYEKWTTVPPPHHTPLKNPTGSILNSKLFPAVQAMLQPGDIVFAETGSNVGHGSRYFALPKGSVFHNQTLYGSIGWGTAAAFGAAMAAPDRRVVFITGDGSHQFTANEIGVMGRYKAKNLTIIVLNNSLFGIEELLTEHAGHEYDDLAPWEYATIPAAQGCKDWVTKRATTMEELTSAYQEALTKKTSAYLELIADKADTPHPLPMETLNMLYRSYPTLKNKK